MIAAGMLVSVGIANEPIRVGDVFAADRATGRVTLYKPEDGYSDAVNIYQAIFNAEAGEPVLIYGETPRLNGFYAPPKAQPKVEDVDFEALQREFREKHPGLIPDGARIWVGHDGVLISVEPYNDEHEISRLYPNDEWQWTWNYYDPPTVIGVTAIAQFAARVMECANLIQKLKDAGV